jgi:uncharacterized protein YndB with AHSA1/START domain
MADAIKTVTITRVFDAPRDLVFKVWTDPKHVAQWWGPRGFTAPLCEWNAKPGGKINVTMRANDEIAKAIGFRDHPMGGEFREVTPPSKLVFTSTAFDGPGGPKLRNLNTVTFEAQGNKTKVTLVAVVEYAAPGMEMALGGMEQGWSESLDKLAETVALQSPAAFCITRTVNAPRDLVFKTWTEAKHLERWWGPPGMPITVAKLELKPGGLFHYYSTMNGRKFWGRFVYREIVTPERLAFVTSFSDEAGGIAPNPMNPAWPRETLSVIDFAEENGKTTMRMTGAPFNATEAEHKVFAENHHNLEKGFGGTFAQLDAYLAKL